MKDHNKAIAEYDRMLQKHIDRKHTVKILRTFRGIENDVFGYLLKLSEHFMLLQAYYDFSFDGYRIVPKDRFDGIRYNKFDKTAQKIMEAEGSLMQLGISYDVDLAAWQTIFTTLKANDRHVIVECEDKKKQKFIIGAIERIGKRSVKILNYDATGLVDKKPTSIKYDDITIIHFDDKYSTTFRKHLRTRKEKDDKKPHAV
jgi:hypothetical protein